MSKGELFGLIGLIGQNRDNRLDHPSPLQSALDRLHTLQNNPNNPNNPPAAVAAALPPDLPPADLPLCPDRPDLSREAGAAIVREVAPLPVDAIRWVCAQAERYDAAFPEWQPPALREQAACLDLLRWLRREHLEAPATADSPAVDGGRPRTARGFKSALNRKLWRAVNQAKGNKNG